MTLVLPNNPNDRNKIRDAMKEISGSFTRVESERDFVNDVLDRLEEEYELPKKEMRKLAKIYHKQNVNEVVNETKSIEDAYNLLMSS